MTDKQMTIQFPRFGINNSNWKGGKMLTESGYVRFTGGAYRGQLEHRVVMGVFSKQYQIHHRDGKPWHNVKSNLKVYCHEEHSALSARRKQQNREQVSIYDITPSDLHHFARRGVHVPSRLLGMIQESWLEDGSL